MNRKDTFGKIPPQAVEIEELVLGQMLVDTDCVLEGLLMLSEESFYKETNRLTFRAIAEMKEGVDIVTVTQHCKKNGTLEMTGGAYYISDLPTRVGTTWHFKKHCLILLEMEIKRKLIAIGFGSEAWNDDSDAFEELEKNQDQLKEIYERINRMKRKSVSDVWDLEYHVAFETGFTDLDEMLKIGEGEYIIIAGRPSMGKSLLMLLMAIKQKSVIISLEQTIEQVARRMKRGGMDKNTPVIIIDSLRDLSDIESECEIQVRNGARVIFLDYLQLVRCKAENRTNEVSKVSQGLQALAKRLKVPIIALSQLSRAVGGRKDKRPEMTDLRDSGSIEQDADSIIMLFRPAYYNETEYEFGGEMHQDLDKNTLLLLLPKVRDGRTGEIRLRTKFSEMKLTDWEAPQILPF